MGKVILFVSAFVPMYILFLINSLVCLFLGHLDFNITNILMVIILGLLSLLGVGGLIFQLNCKAKEKVVVKIISKKNLTDQHFLNYFSLFVLLSITFDLSKISFICVFAVIIVFIGIVYIKNNIFYINPLLNILGYSFYDIVYVEGDKKKELRVFYKGILEINKEYTICACNKNMNILKTKRKEF